MSASFLMVRDARRRAPHHERIAQARPEYWRKRPMTPEPIFDLAHLGHLELLTPKPDESLKFFVDVMGMT
eukprot:gene51616-70292_t